MVAITNNNKNNSTIEDRELQQKLNTSKYGSIFLNNSMLAILSAILDYQKLKNWVPWLYCLR